MNPRIVLSLAGLVVIVVAFVMIFEYPQYANEAFFLLLGWMVVNFALLYALRPRARPAPSGAGPVDDVSPFPSQAPASAPLPSSSTPSSPLGFCIYCAAPVSPGTRACPACGHVLPQW